MVGNVIVAVVCNLVAVVILILGIFFAKRNGVAATVVNTVMAIGGLIGAYFLIPVISDKILGVDKVPELLSQIGISIGTLNSCMYLVFYSLVCAIAAIIAAIVKHASIKKLQDKKLNRIKIKRAKSINPSAEKAVRRAEWKALKHKFAENNKWYHQLISAFLGAIVAVASGIVVLMPFGFIGKDIDAKKEKPFLVEGYKYTLNGVIGDEFFDWVVSVDEEESQPEQQPSTPSTPSTPETPAPSTPVPGEGTTPEA